MAVAGNRRIVARKEQGPSEVACHVDSGTFVVDTCIVAAYIEVRANMQIDPEACIGFCHSIAVRPESHTSAGASYHTKVVERRIDSAHHLILAELFLWADRTAMELLLR